MYLSTYPPTTYHLPPTTYHLPELRSLYERNRASLARDRYEQHSNDGNSDSSRTNNAPRMTSGDAPLLGEARSLRTLAASRLSSLLVIICRYHRFCIVSRHHYLSSSLVIIVCHHQSSSSVVIISCHHRCAVWQRCGATDAGVCRTSAGFAVV